MRKFAILAAVAFAMVGTTPAAADPPKGEAYGYWAGRICDAIFSWSGPTTNPYWVNQDYKNRGQCVSAHVEWLKAGNSVPWWA